MSDALQAISSFLKKHHVLTLATQNQVSLWSCNCFYTYIPEQAVFVFTSDQNTRHIKDALANPQVAGTVVLETRIIGKIQGVQFSGELHRPNGDDLEKYKKAYLKRFPYARFMLAELWYVKVNYFKFTDNTLGFGKKLVWERGETNKDVE